MTKVWGQMAETPIQLTETPSQMTSENPRECSKSKKKQGEAFSMKFLSETSTDTYT